MHSTVYYFFGALQFVRKIMGVGVLFKVVLSIKETHKCFPRLEYVSMYSHSESSTLTIVVLIVINIVNNYNSMLKLGNTVNILAHLYLGALLQK